MVNRNRNKSSDEVSARLKNAGLKLTPQRVAVYQALAAVSSHPTAEELYASILPAYPMMSLNTVYTTLATLGSLGLIQEMRFLDNTVRYDANVAPHHHVVCLSCRRVEDFEDSALDGLRPPASVRKRYRVISHHVRFFGYCSACPSPDEVNQASASTRQSVRRGE